MLPLQELTKLGLQCPRLVFTLGLLLSAVLTSNAQNGQWRWRSRDGQIRTRTELEEILQNPREGILRGANLSGETLVGADLRDTILSDADLSGANVSGAWYEPATAPPPHSMVGANNLDELLWRFSPKALSELRTSLRVLGFRWGERQVIAALRRHDPSTLETVLIDWTSEFGANALRPLKFAGAIWLICTLLYWRSLHREGRSGLYLLASGKKLNIGNERLRIRRLRYHPPRGCRGYRYIFRMALREGYAIWTVALVSLMRAFNIGFRELNFGRWIRLLQTREFDIKARGKLRFVSGMQSLLSVGFLALSLLSYFSTPFAP